MVRGARGLITTQDIKGTDPTRLGRLWSVQQSCSDSAGKTPGHGGADTEAPGNVTEHAVRGQRPCFK